MPQIAANFNLRRKLYNARFGVLERYMRERGLRRPLQRRIRRFYEYYLERKSVFSIESILHEVSSTLKHELCDHFFGDIVSDVPFFQGRDPSFVALVCLKLEPFFMEAGEFVCRKGVIGTELYFLRKGSVHLRVAGSRVLCCRTERANTYY